MEKRDFIYITIISILILGILFLFFATRTIHKEVLPERLEASVRQEITFYLISKEKIFYNNPPVAIIFGERDTDRIELFIKNNLGEDKNFTIEISPDNSTLSYISYNDIVIDYPKSSFTIHNSSRGKIIPITISSKMNKFPDLNSDERIFPKFIIRVFTDNEEYTNGSFYVVGIPQSKIDEYTKRSVFL